MRFASEIDGLFWSPGLKMLELRSVVRGMGRDESAVLAVPSLSKVGNGSGTNDVCLRRGLWGDAIVVGDARLVDEEPWVGGRTVGR